MNLHLQNNIKKFNNIDNMKNFEIHFWDFPNDVYILLEDDFRINLFTELRKILGGYKGMKKSLNVSFPTLLSWKRAMDGSGNTIFCSVKTIKRISKILVENDFNGFSLEEMEKHIKAYRTKAGRLWICNPNLPIIDSIELREFIIHLMGDGSAVLTPHRTCKYASTSKDVVENFSRILNVFGTILRYGKIRSKIRKEKPGKNRLKYMHIYTVPKVLPKIISHYFNIRFDTFNARIPKEFFHGEREFLVSILRAFLVDEGNIRDTRATFSSGNKRLLDDIRKICKLLNYNCNNIEKRRNVFYLTINTPSIRKFYKDISDIGGLSIKYKQERLELAVKLSKSKREFSNLDEKILIELSQKPMTILDLSMNLDVRGRAIWGYLKQLENERKVKVQCKKYGKGGAQIWCLSKNS